MFKKVTSSIPLLAASALIASLVGCGGGSSTPSMGAAQSTDGESTSGSTSTAGSSTTTGGSTTTGSSTGGTATNSVIHDYDGNWVAACTVSQTGLTQGGYEKIAFLVNGDAISTTIYAYTDAACTQPASIAEIVIGASVVYTGETTQTDVGMANNVDVQPESIAYDGQSPTAQEQAILASFGLFDIQYEILVTDGSKLYIGDKSGSNDGSTAAKRPTNIIKEDSFSLE